MCRSHMTETATRDSRGWRSRGADLAKGQGLGLPQPCVAAEASRGVPSLRSDPSSWGPVIP
jgi:hypothetical protein